MADTSAPPENSSSEGEDRLVCADLILDLDTRELTKGDGEPQMLTPKECKLLKTFILNRGEVLSRKFLMKEVWETDYTEDTRTLEVHVSWLRSKIEDDRANPRYLHTVRGVGYWFEPNQSSASAEE